MKSTSAQSINYGIAPPGMYRFEILKVMFHYMPWFETPETHPQNKWGLHWTMELNNPGKS